MKRIIYKIWYYFHSAIEHPEIISSIKEEGLSLNPPFTAGIAAGNRCNKCHKNYKEIFEEEA